VSGIKAQQVAATVKARAGRLDVDPISASVYQGTLAGSVAVNASDDTFIVKQRLAGVGVGPLVRDAADKDLLEGRGTVVIDVTTGGNTVTRLKKGLGGTARLAVTNGVIKGVDLAGIVRAASLVLDSRRALERGAEAGAKTEFSELGGSFVIRNGVAHNEDLRVTSALLQVAGRGDIDIGEGTMDYAARVSLTSAAAGLGGKDLARFAGVPVPVRATGPLGSPKYSVDVGGLATEFARRTLQRELERHIGGSQSRGQPEGAGAVGDLLRGLFGKPK
jgi:AsmA protein